MAPEPAKGFLVAVESTSGKALGGAEVTVILPDGTRLTALADGAGLARVTGVPETGGVTAYVWAEGHRPTTVSGVLEDGRAGATAVLKPGQVGAVTVDSHPMTYEEIIEAGIDPDDPDHVVLQEEGVGAGVLKPGER